jgi:hypothetical protein
MHYGFHGGVAWGHGVKPIFADRAERAEIVVLDRLQHVGFVLANIGAYGGLLELRAILANRQLVDGSLHLRAVYLQMKAFRQQVLQHQQVLRLGGPGGQRGNDLEPVGIQVSRLNKPTGAGNLIFTDAVCRGQELEKRVLVEHDPRRIARSGTSLHVRYWRDADSLPRSHGFEGRGIELQSIPRLAAAQVDARNGNQGGCEYHSHQLRISFPHFRRPAPDEGGNRNVRARALLPKVDCGRPKG